MFVLAIARQLLQSLIVQKGTLQLLLSIQKGMLTIASFPSQQEWKISCTVSAVILAMFDVVY